jgi:hypothetical protein
VYSYSAPSQGNGYQNPGFNVPLGDTLIRYFDGIQYSAYYLFADIASDTQLRGCLLHWSRAVSPAPSVATFGDVPQGHPQFPFIEALVRAGITGGCGGANYCPDAAVTRGQLAVFLSAALGLHWPF